MEKIFKYLVLTITLTLLSARADAAGLGENSRVSLLTCSPGTEVWSNYGHTALRVCDPDTGLDVCFNYGIFSFSTPHFIWRFCTGETDYIVGAQNTDSFIEEYVREGRGVTEQVLNLDLASKNEIWNALCVNIQPQNRTYRYNFFYDNCATRVRRMIENHCGNVVEYPGDAPFTTMREAVEYYTEDYPWTRFGISLVLGAPADSPASYTDQMFAPEVMMDAFDSAVIGGEPLVLSRQTLTEGRELHSSQASLPSPDLVLCIIFAVCAFVSGIELQKKKRFRAVDGILWGIAGLAGTVIAFLALVSEHPATDPNYLLIWLDPLALVYAIALCFRKFRNSRAADFVQIVFLPFVVFALAGFFFLPQTFHTALIPFNLSLLFRCVLAVVNSLNRSGHRKHLK